MANTDGAVSMPKWQEMKEGRYKAKTLPTISPVLHHLYKPRVVYFTINSSNVQMVATVCQPSGGKTLPCGDGAKR